MTMCGVRLQLQNGGACVGVELGRKRLDPEIRPIPIQHAKHEEVAANECSAGSGPFEARRARMPPRLAPTTSGMWHDWQLRSSGTRCAATRDREPARAATRRPRPVVQARSCTACGTLRTTPTAGCGWPRSGVTSGRGVHQARATGIHLKWSEDGRAGWGRGLDDETTGEALRRAQPVAADLMAERAGHAICREACAFGIGSDRQMREDLSVPARGLRDRARHRHVACGALVLDRWPLWEG